MPHFEKALKFFREGARFSLLAALLAVFPSLFSCSKPESDDYSSPFVVSGIILPEELSCEQGAAIELKFLGKSGPVEGDKVHLAGSEGSFSFEIDKVESDSFTFTLPQEVMSGNYDFCIIRGKNTRKIGVTRLFVTSADQIDPDGASVYGKVACRGEGISGVVVSDGVNTCVTDKNGIYRLNSAKKHGYVAISVPSGYDPLTNGVLPVIHRQLQKGKTEAERVDFPLYPAPGQDNITMLILGDIHLACRNSDRKQFSHAVDDLNEYISSHSTDRLYGLTLGDMTWDLYWIVNDYGYTEYLADISQVKNLMIYHTIGNHDYSMYYKGDFATVAEYKRLIAPTYYSFNIGGVHYVVLDDMICTNSVEEKDSNGNPCYKREYYADIDSEQ